MSEFANPGRRPALFDLAGGRADREEGMASALSRASDWGDRAGVVIDFLAATGLPFTSEDVTEVVGLPPAGCSPNAVGAVMNAASRRGVIQRIGDTVAVRRNQHATRIGLWRGVPE